MSNSTTNLDQIASSSVGKEILANALFDAFSPVSNFGRRASTSTALTWGYYGANMWVDGVLTQIANGTLSLTASTTCYIEVDRTGTVSFNTTGFTAGRIPLYTVITGTSTVTSYTDWRLPNIPITGRLSKSVAGNTNITLTAAESANDILEFTGGLTGNINVVIPLAPKQRTIYNNTSGAFTITIIGPTGTGIVVAQTKRAIVYSDGTNINRVTADT
jgi:hypothetical protein